MLMIRKYKEIEKQEIIDLLTSEKINDLDLTDHIHIAIEDNIIIGVCKVKIENKKGILKYIVVKESNRGEMLGDGILRAVFNSLKIKGIQKIYFDEINSYLLKIGFLENYDNKLELNLSEFFTPSCKCSEICREVLK